MKKFFHRFSTTVDKGGVDSIARHVNDDSITEKLQVQDNHLNKDKTASGDKVKALAARFENLSGVESHQQRKNGQPTLPVRSSSQRRSGRTESNARKSSTSPAAEPIYNAPSSDLQRQASSPSTREIKTERDLFESNNHHLLSSSSDDRSTADHTNSAKLSSSTFRATKDGREFSGASGSSLTNPGGSHQQMNSKTVAFAPSPKKPIRPSSPPPAMQPYEDSIHLANVGNFAKATLASTARARTAPKQQNSTDGTASSSSLFVPQSPATAVATVSRPDSSLATGWPQPRRNSSSSGPARRGSNGWTAAGEKSVVSPPNATTTSSTAGAQAPSTGLLSVGQGSDPLANSIPFASHIRSASPQSIGTSSSRLTGYHAMSGNGSRRDSWSGRLFSAGSTSQGWASSGAKSIGGPSWSEMTQDDLVSNLGSRERTRQEVLWEIVASEERYVKELERTKEFYLDALLHPLRFSSSSTPRLPNGGGDKQRNSLVMDVNGNLPIAARFMGADQTGMDGAATPNNILRDSPNTRQRQNAESTVGTVSSPSAKSVRSATKTGNSRRWSNGRPGGFNSGPASSQTGYTITEGHGLSVPLPASLRISLEAVANGMIEGHQLLSEALKQRYEEQWPLVRSLADVFSRYAYVLQHYKDYVMHLERALDCLEEAALMERAMRGKRLKKEKLTMTVGLGRAVASLESAALERGECSLAIFLSMPFQRLLKYPLLFQNLLFHTDASTYEFESTVKMVVDVEEIVRSIEDDKANKEDRDKTIDAFARIDGIKDKALLRPKRDRLLIEERAMYEENPRRAISESNEGKEGSGSENSGAIGLSSQNNTSSSGTLRAALKNKRSYRRLSEFLTVEDRPNQPTKAPNMGSKKDLWLVRFSDVELRCQRVGVTALPMVSSVVFQQPLRDGQENDDKVEAEMLMTEEEARIKEDFKRTKESKERMKALRNMTLRSKTRNLYKFVSVTSWKQVQKEKGLESDNVVEGLISPQEVDEEGDEDGEEEDDEDKGSSTSQETDIGVLDTERYVRQSKLSFSYWGHDKVDPKPLPMTRTQSQHASSVAAYRSRDTFQTPKRHSLTSPIPSFSPVVSSKAVASNSHSKSKADKFGSRLRQTQDTGLMGNQRTSTPRLAGTSKTNVVENIPDNRLQQQILQRRELPANTSLTSTLASSHYQQQQRPSLARDRSIDSNLKLISSLIDSGRDDGSTWI